MYRHCLFCQSDLGANEVIEPMPIGRRVAFDAERGRLWVVCRKCERWNLTAFDERWEAIEECERQFRATRLRMSTDNIGLARVGDGLELVRIGDPLRPEMAAWRYGDQFGRRRRRHFVTAGAAGGVLLALVAGAAYAGVGTAFWGMMHGAYTGILDRLGRTRIPTPDGRLVKLVPSKARKARLSYDRDTHRIQLSLKSDKKIERWFDDDAREIAALVLPRANYEGARATEIRRAVDLVAELPSGDDPLLRLIGRGRITSGKPVSLHDLAAPKRLALEMALHEAQERRALEGELQVLELRWQDAERIAAIADSLTLPDSVEVRLAALKGAPQSK